MNRYSQALVKNASKLDALTDACGEITKLATAIVEEHNKGDTISLLKKISEAVDNPNYQIEVKRIAQLINSSLIEFYGSTLPRRASIERGHKTVDPGCRGALVR